MRVLAPLSVALVVVAGVWLLPASNLDHEAPTAPAAPPAAAGRAGPAGPAGPTGAAATGRSREPRTPAVRGGAPTRPAAAGGRLLLPTGERVRALNGVRTEIRLLWPAARPYSPITGITTQADGLQWYVHEDGSHSTTEMVYRSDLGRRTAMSVVANPHPVLPLQAGHDAEPDLRR